MITGFRVGDDDFANARRRWALPVGTAPLGRVFPDGQPCSATKVSPDKLVALIEAKAKTVRAAGMVPFPSFKPNVPDTLSGRFDEHFRAVGQWCLAQPAGVYLTVWHEWENDLMGAPPTDMLARARNFTAVYTRAAQLIKGVAGDRVKMGPVNMAYQWRRGTPSTADGLVAEAGRTPAELTDWCGLDIYTSNWSWNAGRAVADKADFARWRTWLGDDAKILLVERGITSNAGAADKTQTALGRLDDATAQAQILAADYVFLASIGAHGMMYWNSGGATDTSVFMLADAGIRAFRQIAIVAAMTLQAQPGVQALHRQFEAGRQAAYANVVTFAAAARDTAAAAAA